METVLVERDFFDRCLLAMWGDEPRRVERAIYTERPPFNNRHYLCHLAQTQELDDECTELLRQKLQCVCGGLECLPPIQCNDCDAKVCVKIAMKMRREKACFAFVCGVCVSIRCELCWAKIAEKRVLCTLGCGRSFCRQYYEGITRITDARHRIPFEIVYKCSYCIAGDYEDDNGEAWNEIRLNGENNKSLSI